MKRICNHCGKELSRGQRKFCSLRCQHDQRHEISKAKRTRTCETCGKVFVMGQPSQKANRGEVKEGRFCSRKCKHYGMRNPDKPAMSCRVYFRTCDVCGNVFASRRINKKRCSYECSKKYERYRKYEFNASTKELNKIQCKMCGKKFIPKYGDKRTAFCSNRCAKKYATRKFGGNKWRKKARHYGVDYEPINIFRVFRRDGWTCQICGKPTPKKNRGTRYSNAPELDHRVPISRGGDHLYSNVQCACRRCNILKSNNSSVGQLPMFGIGSSV